MVVLGLGYRRFPRTLMLKETPSSQSISVELGKNDTILSKDKGIMW